MKIQEGAEGLRNESGADQKIIERYKELFDKQFLFGNLLTDLARYVSTGKIEDSRKKLINENIDFFAKIFSELKGGNDAGA